MMYRCDFKLRQAPGKKPNPKGILKRLITEIKKILKVASSSGKKWGKAKAEKTSLEAKEIEARILAGEIKLEQERLRMVQEYELEKQRIENDHDVKMGELKIKHQREQREAIKDTVKVIKDLKDMGVDIDFRIVKGKFNNLFDIITESNEVSKEMLEGDIDNTPK